MTLEKAIEVQTRYLTHPYIKGEHELQDAAKLGIEAMKLIRTLRKWGVPRVNHTLPGETRE